jgi:integrase
MSAACSNGKSMNANDLQFTIYRRKGSKNWQAQFRDGKGRSVQRGTGTPNRLEAFRIASDWQQNGLPQDRIGSRRQVTEMFSTESLLETVRNAPLSNADAGQIVEILCRRGLVNVQAVKETRSNILLVKYLADFWDFEHSAYVKEKLAHGQRISKRHCYESTNRVKYWKKAFPGLLLSDLEVKKIGEFALSLKNQGLSSASLNKIMLVCSTGTSWAKRNGLLDIDPFEGSMHFSESHEKRGILTAEEVTKLFTEGKWADNRARIASLLACTTGLRAGECRAVQVQDIQPDRLFVWAWSDLDGRKQPKNGENRTVPLLPEVYKELQALVAMNPYGGRPESYIFYSAAQDKPIRPEPLLHDFEAALCSIGIDHEIRSRRNIDFHSWRHYYSTTMASIISSNKIRVVTGHKSASVFQGYSDHAREADIRDVALAEKEVFACIFGNSQPDQEIAVI